MSQQKIALLASGTGSNALNIISYFKENKEVNIEFVLSNKSSAPIVESAKKLGIKVITCSKLEVENDNYLLSICKEHKIDYIILAGFLRKIPSKLIEHYPEKIVNIHPALLPNYGGEGMYGKFVHLEVIKNRERETGITIHFVNSEYDKGRIIAQFKCDLTENEALESVQAKIHDLEMAYFPRVIEKVLSNSIS